MSYSEFQKPHVIRAIKKLARPRNGLTVVIGAGSSVESGLPSWKDLVTSLLATAARKQGLVGQDSELFSAWTSERENLTGAGEIARQLLGDTFRPALHEALYSGVEALVPGETSRALACLRLDRRTQANEVVTTNYDLLLEQALREEVAQRGLQGFAVERLVDAKVVGPSTIGVRHLHGVLTQGNLLVGNLVLSDSDYHLMQDSGAWQESYFKTQLDTSTCVFVGTSLTDPNLLRYIYRSGHKARHYAVFVRQGDSSLYDAATQKVVDLREQSQVAKWRAVNVEPILFDHYAQSAQFLWEVVAAGRTGQYTLLSQRLSRWRDDLKTVFPTDRIAFNKKQDQLQRVMSKVLAGTKVLLNGEGHRLRKGEKLGVSLWVYNPADESLVNWASADRVWRDPTTLEPIRIHWSSPFVAAKAFCAGTMVSQSTSEHVVSRWNHVIGFPIYLHRVDGRLPIGVVTLASTERMDRSLLERGSATVRASAIPAIEQDVGSVLGASNVPIDS